MAKEPKDVAEELPADKAKRLAAEAAEQPVVADEQPKLADEAEAARERILAGDDEGDEEEDSAAAFSSGKPKLAARKEAAEEAAKKLRLIATAYPETTPHEHTIFGFGGHRFTLGELRDLFDLKRW